MNNQATIAIFSACCGMALGLVLSNKFTRPSPSSNLLKDCARKPHGNDDKTLVLSHIAAYPDFPQKGILFRDIFPILRSPSAFQALVRLLHDRIKSLGKIDVIVGLESRGFLIGPLLATLIGCSFVPVRKPGKLPGKLTSVSYEKEYGKDTFDIQTEAIKPGDRVVFFDDLLATGGSLFASTSLVTGLGGIVVECIVIIELADIQGRKNVPHPVWSLFQFD